MTKPIAEGKSFVVQSVKRYDWSALGDALVNYLRHSPGGVTLYDICNHLDITAPVARKAISRARADLAEAGSTDNIITKVAGLERLYCLAGAHDGAALSEWLSFHEKSLVAHAETVKAVYESMLASATTKGTRQNAEAVIIRLDELIAAIG